MSRTTLSVAAVVVVLASGCARSTWRSQDVAVEFAFRPEVPALPILNSRLDVRPRVSPLVRDIVQGEPVPVAFTIANIGKHPVILLRLEASQMPGTLVSWTHPVYGRLTYDEKAGAYDFFPGADVRSGRQFHSGFLFPGEERTLSVELTFRESGKVRQDFTLTYWWKVPELLREDVFVPEKQGPGPSVRYVRPRTADLEEWKKTRSRFGNILFRRRGGERVFSFSREFEVRPVSFSYKQAVAKVGFRSDVFDYSPWMKGWALERDGDVVVVTPVMVERYEGVTLEVFKFIESHRGYYLPVEAVSVRLREGSVPFHIGDEETYVAVADVLGAYRSTLERGHRIEVPVDDVFGLIRTLKTRGFRTFRTVFADEPVLGVEAVKK